MGKKSVFIAIVGLVFLLTGVSAPAMAAKAGAATIVQPAFHQEMAGVPVEIVVQLEGQETPAGFRAWLNWQDITAKFSWNGSEGRALVSPEDGLRVYSEAIETTRDDKGVWFIRSKTPRRRAGRGLNVLWTKTGKGKRFHHYDWCQFRVDASVEQVFKAMGYAVASDRLWQMELYRRSARGTLAEMLGPDQLETDIFMRTIGYSEEELTAGFKAQDGECQALLRGYAAGINQRIAEIREDPTQLPFEFAALGSSPADWTVEDVLAWGALLQRNFDPEALDQAQLNNAGLLQYLQAAFPATALAMFNDLRWTNDPEAQSYIIDEKGPEDQQIDGGNEIQAPADLPPAVKDVCDQLEKRKERIRKNLKKINAKVKMGSYAWVVSGKKTTTGRPIIYSGPQMGFSVPSIVTEGSIQAAGINISGMTVPGIPGIIIGRTPHHAWSMQVGHAHTTDYYFEHPAFVSFHRLETIQVAGADPVTIPVYRTPHGPVVSPLPYNPDTYGEVPDPTNPIVSWRYAHWGHEFDIGKALLGLARAKNMDDFGEHLEYVAVSQHFCYADRNGNIAYWMSGRDPLRPQGEYRLPQGIMGLPQEWDDDLLKPRSTARNPARGFFGGWNNKTSPWYDNAYNSNNDIYGPFQRAHVIYDYLSQPGKLSFEGLRDLAVDIAATSSVNNGGNPWVFVFDSFTQAVNDAGLTDTRKLALETLAAWDGHFVSGGPDAWATGTERDPAWVIADTWIREVIRLTFADELPEDLDADGNGKGTYMGTNQYVLFNVLLHGLAGEYSGIVNQYDWFQNLVNPTAPQTPDEIIVLALDNVMESFGDDLPMGVPRGEIVYRHDMLGPVHSTPFGSRSTYAHVVEYGHKGPLRIESMFPLGESGNILMGPGGVPQFDPNFLSMTPIFDAFQPREFPLFDRGKK
jgi:penicillin G amidase